MKQTNRGHLSTIRQNVLVVVGENLDPFQQASLNLNLLRINLGRTGKLQEMITTDCWSWKSLQHLLVKLQIPTSSAPNNPGLTSKLLCEKELQTRYCNMLSPKFLAAQVTNQNLSNRQKQKYITTPQVAPTWKGWALYQSQRSPHPPLSIPRPFQLTCNCLRDIPVSACLLQSNLVGHTESPDKCTALDGWYTTVIVSRASLAHLKNCLIASTPQWTADT